MESSAELTKRYFVTPGLCNARRELPLPQLVSYVIELATDHANNLGIGFEYSTPRGLGWVLSRLSVEMNRYPRFDEYFTLTTWIEEWNKHFSGRNFMIKSESGEILGYVRTVWMVIDLNDHSNVETTVLPFDIGMIPNLECPIEPFRRIRFAEPDKTTDYTFRYTDIDFYNHVNTVRYIELLLNQFSLSKFESGFIKRLDVAFKHEAKFGDTAKVNIFSLSKDEFCIRLSRKTDILLESRLLFS